jgi:hypothetical protein
VLLLCALSLRVFAQDFVPEQVVFPITDFKPYIQVLPVFLKFGTGFCLDPDTSWENTSSLEECSLSISIWTLALMTQGHGM